MYIDLRESLPIPTTHDSAAILDFRRSARPYSSLNVRIPVQRNMSGDDHAFATTEGLLYLHATYDRHMSMVPDPTYLCTHLRPIVHALFKW